MPNLLDVYQEYVTKECDKAKAENDAFDDDSPLGQALGWLTGAMQGGIWDQLKNSPLANLAEDWVAQQIAQNSSSLILAASGALKGMINDKVMALQNLAFSAVMAALLLQYELIFYMAKEGAKKIVIQAKEDIAILEPLREAVRRLYNALILLENTSPFFDGYLDDLRAALVLINDGQGQLWRLRSAFKSRTFWSKYSYNRAMNDFERAIALMLPPNPTTPDTNLTDSSMSLFGTVLLGTDKGAPNASDSVAQNMNATTKSIAETKDTGWFPQNLGVSDISQSEAYQAFFTVPQLTQEMLDSYNNYVTALLKLNTGLTLFQGIGSNIQTLPFQENLESFLKTFVCGTLGMCRNLALNVVKSMAEELNGGEANVAGPSPSDFRPSPIPTAAKAPLWAIKIMGVIELMKAIDTETLAKINNKAELVAIYEDTLSSLAALGNQKTGRAFMRCTAGREALGDIELDIIGLAAQAMLALGGLGSGTTDITLPGADGATEFDPGSASQTARRVYDRLGLSINNCNLIISIMESYVQRTEPLLGSLNALGDSLVNVLESFGFDKAADLFGSGAIDELLLCSPKTATYAGAAMIALNQILNMVDGDENKKCVGDAITELSAAQKAKEANAENAATNIQDKKKENTAKCKKLQDGAAQLTGCAGSAGLLEVPGLTEDPGKAISNKLMGLFSSLLGGPAVPVSTPVSPGMAASPEGGDAIIAPTNETLGVSNQAQLASAEGNPGEITSA